MRQDGGTSYKPTKRPVIVLAGEDSNDRLTMRRVIEAFCPSAAGRIIEVNDAVRIRAASDSTRRDRIQKLARLVRARAAKEKAEVAHVFVHEDFDAPDSDAARRIRESVGAQLRGEFGDASYVLAVAEVEAWLLMFPEVLNKYRKTWSVPAKFANGADTGMVGDPKEVLQRQVSKSDRYREADAPEIMKRVIDGGYHLRPKGKNHSWDCFIRDIEECCKALAKSPE